MQTRILLAVESLEIGHLNFCDFAVEEGCSRPTDGEEWEGTLSSATGFLGYVFLTSWALL
jgi:hypothetical protein